MSTCRRTGVLAVASIVVFLVASLVHAADASSYRGFRLGMSISEVAAAAAIPTPVVKTVYERPLLVQEVEWSPPDTPSDRGVASARDSVARVLFGFCNGELYRIVVTYNADRTEGLTQQDLIDTLSAVYGPVTKPVTKVITSAASQSYIDTEDVMARWEDAAASVNLFAHAYRSTFGLVIFSRKVAPLVRAAVDEAVRLSESEAPLREAAAQKTRDDLERVAQGKARLINKVVFRY
jgi:hypothetical protein